MTDKSKDLQRYRLLRNIYVTSELLWGAEQPQ